jgi:L-iditol 2-dehydrogenase
MWRLKLPERTTRWKRLSCSPPPAANVVVVGIPSKDYTSFTASTARRKGLTIKLSRRMNRVYPEVIRLVESGFVDVRSVVTATYPLSEFNAAFATAAAREGLKVVVTPSE